VFRETGDLAAVVRHVVEETRAGIERRTALRPAGIVDPAAS